MPKETRVPGAEPPPLTAAEQMEAEIARRVEERVSAELAERVRAAKRAVAQGQANIPRIVEDKSLPSIHDQPPVALARLHRPTEFREGWHVPPTWPGGMRVAPAEPVAEGGAS